MTKRFIRASVVILADAHNPSILTPDWLERNEVITEKHKKFITTPDFAFFDSRNYNLMVDRQRFQLNIKKPQAKKIHSLSQIAQRYFELLPHIPFSRMGLNFDWIVEQNGVGIPPQIQSSIGSIHNIGSLFPDYELHYGAIIFAKKSDYRLRLTLEPIEENALIYKFNFDHNLKDLSINEIKKLPKNFQSLYEFAFSIVNKTTIDQGSEKD